MKKYIFPTLALLILTITSASSQNLQQRAEAAKAAAKAAADKAQNAKSGTGKTPLSNDQVITGLKDALTIGTNNSTGIASKLDGFYKNPKLFIPFPPEAKEVKSRVDAIGMKSQTDKFVMTLNRAAEEAAKKCSSCFYCCR